MPRGHRYGYCAQHLAGLVRGGSARGSAGGLDGVRTHPGGDPLVASDGLGGAVQHHLAGGTRLVSEFLELSGLSAFVGVSDGAQHALNFASETAVVGVAAEQRTALAEGMPPRQVTVCEDETFHPGTSHHRVSSKRHSKPIEFEAFKAATG